MSLDVKKLAPIFTAFGIVAVATILMMLVRFFIVEPESIAIGCAIQNEGWRCVLRGGFVFGFLHNAFGWTAVIAGGFATLTRWRWLAAIAIVSGVAGSVLYTFELSGAGLLLGALAWVGPQTAAPVTDQQDSDEQHA